MHCIVESLEEYLTNLASPSPTPGGGSAATLVAAMGAALVAMAARITAAHPKHTAQETTALSLATLADTLRSQLLEARRRDEEAFAAVMATRGEARQGALERAAEAPLHAMHLALDVEQLAADSLELNNPHLASDLGCAAELAAAALAASAYNVRINHAAMRDARIVAAQTAQMQRYERESAELLRRIRATISAKDHP